MSLEIISKVNTTTNQNTNIDIDCNSNINTISSKVLPSSTTDSQEILSEDSKEKVILGNWKCEKSKGKGRVEVLVSDLLCKFIKYWSFCMYCLFVTLLFA